MYPIWKMSKFLFAKRIEGNDLTLDYVRPIPLTSILVKAIERIVYKLLNFVWQFSVFNPDQIEFRPNWVCTRKV